MTQLRQHGKHSPVVIGGFADPELEEDLRHVRLNGLRERISFSAIARPQG